MATRAQGANAQLALALESSYGTAPTSGYYKVPFVSQNIGDEQDLVASDLLGQGRSPDAPSLDVINNEGDIVVPVDLRNLGFWLKCIFGAPTTTAGLKAEGTITFSENPAADDTITLGGTALTFGDDITVGDTLAESLSNAVLALNESDDANISLASYALNDNGDEISILYDTVGTAGNAFTLAASADTATVSGDTLSGGAASGAYQHVFTSGLTDLASAAVEVGFTDVSKYQMNYGLVVDKIAMSLQRSGLLNATLSTIAQGSDAWAAASSAGTLSSYDLTRFTQFSGAVKRNGVPLGNVVSASWNYDNNYEKAEDIRSDGRIDGADPGQATSTGSAVIRFQNTVLLDLATNGTAIELVHSWKNSSAQKLTITNHEVYLPRPKTPVSGPRGIQQTINWQSAKSASTTNMVTVELINDVGSY